MSTASTPPSASLQEGTEVVIYVPLRSWRFAEREMQMLGIHLSWHHTDLIDIVTAAIRGTTNQLRDLAILIAYHQSSNQL